MSRCPEEHAQTRQAESMARVKVYINAYNAITPSEQSEQEKQLLIDQIMNLPAEDDDSEHADDAAMQTVESIDDLGHTPIIPDTPQLYEERKQAITQQINESKH